MEVSCAFRSELDHFGILAESQLARSEAICIAAGLSVCCMITSAP